ncbi:unnamed protein product, partial [Closterium sp. Naga37s-1]
SDTVKSYAMSLPTSATRHLILHRSFPFSLPTPPPSPPLPYECADGIGEQGMPFRTSHDVVGRAVAIAVARGVELSALSLEELRAINPIFEADVYSFLGVHNSITKFTSFGSTGAARVDEQLKFWRDKLHL